MARNTIAIQHLARRLRLLRWNQDAATEQAQNQEAAPEQPDANSRPGIASDHVDRAYYIVCTGSSGGKG